MESKALKIKEIAPGLGKAREASRAHKEPTQVSLGGSSPLGGADAGQSQFKSGYLLKLCAPAAPKTSCPTSESERIILIQGIWGLLFDFSCFRANATETFASRSGDSSFLLPKPSGDRDLGSSE